MGCYNGFLHPVSIVFRESADKEWEAGFMVFTVKPWFMSFLERSFHREIKEVTASASLDAYATDNFLVNGARLILQEEIMFEQREIKMYDKEGLAQMDEDGDLDDGVRVKMH
jgi:hypothetical protein